MTLCKSSVCLVTKLSVFIVLLVSESSFPLETPQVLKSQPHNPDMAANSQGEDDFTAMLSIPDPPVLLTPGVKQVRKWSPV